MKNKDIKKIENWLNKKGFKLLKGKYDHINFIEKHVKINFNKKDKYVLFSLLHECGHLILYNRKGYDDEFYKLNNENSLKKSDQYFYELLKEEMFAWELGLKLAKRMKINIDKSSYKKYSSKFFISYVKHVNELKSSL